MRVPSPLAGGGALRVSGGRMRGHPSPDPASQGHPLPQGERERRSAHAPSVPGPGSGITGWFKELISVPKRGAGCRFSGLLVERYVRLGAQVPPDIPRRSFRLRSGHPFRWADGSARSPGYRNRDRGTRPPLRQRCPVSTAVPPPETSVSDIGIKAGFVKAHRCATHPAPHPEVRSEAKPRRTQDGPAGSLRARACFEARLWLAPQHEEGGAG